MKTVSAIVLAAGRSLRMGRFKPLLPFGETTIIGSCIDNLLAVGVDELIVVVGHRASELQDHLKDLPLKFAVNPDPDSQMSVSIARGLEKVSASTGAIIITPADHPAISADVTRAIINQWRAGELLVVPEYQGRGGHPVLLDSRFRTELLAFNAEGGLRSFFVTHKNQVSRVPVESSYIARDLDTWDDYLQLHQEIFNRPPIANASPGTGRGKQQKAEPN